MLSSLEKNLIKNNFRIAGLDESGRGPLAGSVVAAAVTITNIRSFCKNYSLSGDLVKDSKMLSLKKREWAYSFLKNCPFIEWGVAKVSEGVIDKINILAASQLAMEKAVTRLNKKLKKQVNFLILDGNIGINLKIRQKSIIQGDKKIFLVSAASIIAKVSRDRMMVRYGKKYPGYNFEKNKGYGTREHIRLIKKNRPCSLHRKSFEPVRTIVKNKFL
jgi:ribonuclease HII